MAHTPPSDHEPGDAGRGAEAAREVRRAGADIGRTALELGEERADQGRQRATRSLETAAERLREAGSDLRDDDEALAGALVERAARGLGEAAGFLRERRTGEMLADMSEFGRRHPALFLGASAAAGLLLARVARTAAERQTSPAPSGPAGQYLQEG